MSCSGNSKTKSFKLCRCSCRWKCKCLIPRKRKPHPPFNSGVSIDFKRGMHPLLGKYSNDAPPPGTYDPPPIVANCPVTSWQKEEATKEFSATMGGKVLDKYIVQRDLMKRGRGPGTHEIKQWPETVLEQKCNTGRSKDIGFGIVPRFKNSYARATPGPGYTGKDHNPYYYVDKNRFKSPSCLPTFEFDGPAPRFKESSLSWSLACNRYNVRHPECLDNILKKVTSRRGPYDLFTGPRDHTTLFGYMAKQKLTDTKNWPMIFPSEFEKSVNGSNRYKGVWTNCPRFTKKPTVRSMLDDISLCYKDPNSPGPGSYDPIPYKTSITEAKYAFNDSVKNARPLRPHEISPGPGTYGLTSLRRRISGNGWTWIFKSKVQRTIGPKQDQYNAF